MEAITTEIEVRKAARSGGLPSISREIGSTGIRYYGGIITDEYLPRLAGQSGIRTYREMTDDPVIAALFFAIDMNIRQVQWYVEPFSNEQRDQDTAKFVTECMHDMSMPWTDVVSDALSMLPYGWCVQEIVYKRRDGDKGDSTGMSSDYDDRKVGWRKFAPRPQDTLQDWVLDEQGGVNAFKQYVEASGLTKTIPIGKMLLYRTTNTGKSSPEGRSVLRAAYRPWYYRKRLEEIEAIGIERDLAGMPVAHVDPSLLDPNASDDKKALLNSIKTLVVNIRRDQQEGVIFPSSYDASGNALFKFELMSAGGSRQFDISAVIERYTRQIAMTVMADFILLGHQGVGSYALSNDKTSMFVRALGTWLGVIKAVVNRYAVPRLLRVNNMDMSRAPTIEHGDIAPPDLTMLSDYLTKLVGIGMSMLPDEKLEAYLREVGGLPEKDESTTELQRVKEAQQIQQADLNQRQMVVAAEQAERQLEASELSNQQQQLALVQMREQLVQQAVPEPEPEPVPVRKRRKKIPTEHKRRQKILKAMGEDDAE